MRGKTLLLSTIVLVLLLSPLPARAGGGWWSSIDYHARYLGAGESLTVRSEFSFRNMELARKARSNDYRAYLIRGVDTERLDRAMSGFEPKRWWTPPKEMILIGDVTLSGWNANIGTAVAHSHT